MTLAIMRKFALIFLFLSLTSCSLQATGKSASSLKAVYFVRGQGELSSDDLQAHPEIVVVQTFDDFKKYASQKIALWVDKNATPFNAEQEKWINEAPQAYYPIVLVGTSDTLHAFKNLLGLCCFMGPAGDYPGYDAPGFSVLQWEATNAPDERAVILLQGYDQKPTVQAILDITNALLEGKLEPTPTVPSIPVPTPTP
jgi:hypothetical protein